ncbi:MAG: GNAT family N-acetyltransferase [Planctomycetes bacterium]|nr:GNAT family N-acetyltransferase [Planctomycetota bacterium]
MEQDLSGNVFQVEVPIASDQRVRFTELWERLFEVSYEALYPVLSGSEGAVNRNVIYYCEDNRSLMGTCQLTVRQTDPFLGGLGEVAVAEPFREQGIATLLCRKARDDFFSVGGEALFLGTVNPAAERIYKRLGWQPIPGTSVMVAMRNDEIPEAFFARYFDHDRQPVSCRVARANVRIPLIPLALYPHKWKLLDANTGLVSTRYVVQHSCMGLYPKYGFGIGKPRAAAYACWTSDDRLVGMVTVRMENSEVASVDGFVHPEWCDQYENLMGYAIRWARRYGLREALVKVLIEDDEKYNLLVSTGFLDLGRRTNIAVADQQLEAAWLSCNIL